MTAGGTAELRRPLNRAEHQATMARLARSPRTWNRAIHRAIVARFGEAGCLMTAGCNESTICHLSCQHGRKGISANPLTERPVVSNALIF